MKIISAHDASIIAYMAELPKDSKLPRGIKPSIPMREFWLLVEKCRPWAEENKKFNIKTSKLKKTKNNV